MKFVANLNDFVKFDWKSMDQYCRSIGKINYVSVILSSFQINGLHWTCRPRKLPGFLNFVPDEQQMPNNRVQLTVKKRKLRLKRVFKRSKQFVICLIRVIQNSNHKKSGETRITITSCWKALKYEAQKWIYLNLALSSLSHLALNAGQTPRGDISPPNLKIDTQKWTTIRFPSEYRNLNAFFGEILYCVGFNSK